MVAGQHTANKCHALVCSHCYQFLGSIGLQVAWCQLAAAADGMYLLEAATCILCLEVIRHGQMRHGLMMRGLLMPSPMVPG